MKKAPTISVGIPAYNEEGNIAKLIHSILSQQEINYRLEEIIIITDGSVDNTVGEITKIQDSRIRLTVGKNRKGQNSRLNEILDQVSSDTDCLLIFEADTLPVGDLYIEALVATIPKDRSFSVIVGDLLPVKARSFFGKVMNFGFLFRREIFKNSTSGMNLYLFSGSSRLLSRKFLSQFRWDVDFHEDSYCYRKVLESGLPIVRNENAKIYIKTPETLKDFLLQSGKFQKARKLEESHSDIYRIKFNYIGIFKVLLKNLTNNFFLLACYLLFMAVSRIYARILPKYSVFWETYDTTKNLQTGNVPYN